MTKFRIFLMLPVLGVFLTHCAKGPSPAQITALEEAERTAEAASAEQTSLEQELRELEGERERSKMILSENESEHDLLKGRMGK